VIVGGSNAYSPNLYNHHTRLTIGPANTILLDTLTIGYNAINVTKQIPVSSLAANGATNFKINIVGDLGVASDYQSVNYWTFLYPRTLALPGINKTEFQVSNAANQPKIKLALSGVSMINPIAFVFGSNPKVINAVFTGNTCQLLVPNDPVYARQKVVVQATTTISSITGLTPVTPSATFTDFSATPNIQEALLFVYPKKLASGVFDYANYRSSPAGGNYNVILSEVEELYDQFGGGISKHVNGIRRYAHYLHSLSQQKPVGLFLMGKGIREANVATTLATGPGARANVINYSMNLVPSFGQPSSDQSMTSNLPGTDKWTPLIPTGRIAVNNLLELALYLDKVKAFELAQDSTSSYDSQSKDWQKHLIHFAGGGNANEQ